MSNVSGSPIFKSSNLDCEFVLVDKGKKDNPKFDECTCPVRKWVMKENNYGSIIRCAANFEECPIYAAQNKKHIKIIKVYIEKFSVDGWINVSDKHIKALVEDKIGFADENYLLSLFNFHGYNKIEDDKVEGLVLTKYKVAI